MHFFIIFLLLEGQICISVFNIIGGRHPPPPPPPLPRFSLEQKVASHA